MGRSVLAILFALNVFVGAFLLFQIQPLIGKYILPWFGGSPSVWTTCMLFFQVMLLVGYAYAHGAVTYLSPKGQAVLHIAVLLAAVVMLPIVPSDRWMPTDANDPTLRILGLLAASVGLPFVVLSATGPLVQGWFAGVFPGRSPYRLYALSNAASLIALLSFPVLVEPNVTRAMQAKIWAWLLGGFAVVCGVTAILRARRATGPHPTVPEPPEDRERGIEKERERGAATTSIVALWIALSTCASALLLAVTNKICQDVAVVPLLWVVPLSIYLLTFIICFDRPTWYRRRILIPLMGISFAAVCWLMLIEDREPPIRLQIGVYCVALFLCCMFCHGELVRFRPQTSRLTSYYLAIAFGGALGGALVAVAAPIMLNGYFELHIGLAACGMLVFIVLWRDALRGRAPWLVGAGVLALAAALLLHATSFLRDSTVVERRRNFHGVLRVYDLYVNRPFERQRILQHGGVTHGLQFPARPNLPTAYYGPESGMGIAMRLLHAHHDSIRVGVVGLGVGTVFAYGRRSDFFRAYEINPDVFELATRHFEFLIRSEANLLKIVLGDARMSLAQEPDQDFDIIVLDAFSGDAIPVHLLTRECFEIYLRHLRRGGIIAVHISNQHLDLAPVVLKLAEHFQLGAVYIRSPERREMGQYEARWMLLSTDQAWLGSELIRSAASPVEPRASIRLWTDDDTNLFQIIN
jgi:hypothetical protein